MALLGRVTGRARLLDGAPVLQRSVALRNPYVNSLSELQVRLLARLRACRDDPDRARAPPRAAHRQWRRGRAPEHRLRLDHADHVGLLRPAVEPGGSWADIGAGEGAFTLALADLLGPGGRILAVDRDRARSRRTRTAVRARFPASR